MMGLWTNWILRKRAFFYPKERQAYANQRARRPVGPLSLL
jgi:hypothetical protein